MITFILKVLVLLIGTILFSALIGSGLTLVSLYLYQVNLFIQKLSGKFNLQENSRKALVLSTTIIVASILVPVFIVILITIGILYGVPPTIP